MRQWFRLDSSYLTDGRLVCAGWEAGLLWPVVLARIKERDGVVQPEDLRPVLLARLTGAPPDIVERGLAGLAREGLVRLGACRQAGGPAGYREVRGLVVEGWREYNDRGGSVVVYGPWDGSTDRTPAHAVGRSAAPRPDGTHETQAHGGPERSDRPPWNGHNANAGAVWSSQPPHAATVPRSAVQNAGQDRTGQDRTGHPPPPTPSSRPRPHEEEERPAQASRPRRTPEQEREDRDTRRARARSGPPRSAEPQGDDLEQFDDLEQLDPILERSRLGEDPDAWSWHDAWTGLGGRGVSPPPLQAPRWLGIAEYANAGPEQRARVEQLVAAAAAREHPITWLLACLDDAGLPLPPPPRTGARPAAAHQPPIPDEVYEWDPDRAEAWFRDNGYHAQAQVYAAARLEVGAEQEPAP